MSNQALNFVGRLDKREESLVLNEQQEQAFFKRLLGNRGSVVTQKIFGQKRERRVRASAGGGRLVGCDAEKLRVLILKRVQNVSCPITKSL